MDVVGDHRVGRRLSGLRLTGLTIATWLGAAVIAPVLPAGAARSHPPEASAGNEAVIGAFEAAHQVDDACWRVAGTAPHRGGHAFDLGGTAFRAVDVPPPPVELEDVRRSWAEITAGAGRDAFSSGGAAEQRLGCRYGTVFQPVRHGGFAFVHALVPGTRRAWDVFEYREGRWVRVATTGPYRR